MLDETAAGHRSVAVEPELPCCVGSGKDQTHHGEVMLQPRDEAVRHEELDRLARLGLRPGKGQEPPVHAARSEEHTSELQSLMRISYAVFCLKKKTEQ